MGIRKEVLLLAGGKGLRAGGGIPKQFREINGRPLLWWSLRAFYEYDSSVGITIVMNREYAGLWEELESRIPEKERVPYSIAYGGKERTDSVRNGLAHIENITPGDGSADETLVAIHDGARPLVSIEMIARGFETALNYGSATPVIPVTDTLRELKTPGDISRGSVNADRSRYVAVQTPQVFRYNLIAEAYCKNEAEGRRMYTDDASLVEAMTGVKTTLYAGESRNIKVTNPEDFAVAEALTGFRI